MRTPLMAGNWKMNLDHNEAVSLVDQLESGLAKRGHDQSRVEVALLPPYTGLHALRTLIADRHYSFSYGAQDVSAHSDGAYTGEISAKMLRALDCAYVVVGHSERRTYHAESDALVNAKVRRVVDAGMTPLVCVGEGLDVREAGDHVTHTLAQVDTALKDLSDRQVAELVVAYEPVWAIGTGKVASSQDAQEVCSAIRSRILQVWGSDAASTVRVLYGGSVKASSAGAIMAEADIDGCLVGGASLQAEEFAGICAFRQ